MGQWEKMKGNNAFIYRENSTYLIISKTDDGNYFFSSEENGSKNKPCCIDRSAIPEEILIKYPDF
jgi:hypothetical protein